MSAREKMQEMADRSNVNTDFVMDMFDCFIEGVKEECCDSQNFGVVVDLTKKKEPELIQGYTAEQWQEIIGGGYLCEFAPNKTYHPTQVHLGTLNHYDYPQLGYEFYSENHGSFQYCRPAQIKGVRRPIWVEPVDKKAMCVFFNKNGLPIGINGTVTSVSLSHTEFIDTLKDRGATSYMER